VLQGGQPDRQRRLVLDGRRDRADERGRQNRVAPAVIDTSILGQISQGHIDYMTSGIPLGRTGEAPEVMPLICWLASEELSFSTGACYDISGRRATY
jgi:2-dehydro-3-deoxy-L-rhamnonate dehydrogenase (NAD+)